MSHLFYTAAYIRLSREDGDRKKATVSPARKNFSSVT